MTEKRNGQKVWMVRILNENYKKLKQLRTNKTEPFDTVITRLIEEHYHEG